MRASQGVLTWKGPSHAFLKNSQRLQIITLWALKVLSRHLIETSEYGSSLWKDLLVVRVRSGQRLFSKDSPCRTPSCWCRTLRDSRSLSLMPSVPREVGSDRYTSILSGVERAPPHTCCQTLCRSRPGIRSSVRYEGDWS